VCDCTIETAAIPDQSKATSLASPRLFAYVLINKFDDASPSCRQQQIFRWIGTEISSTNLGNWVVKAGQLVQPPISLMRVKISEYGNAGMGENVVQVLEASGGTGIGPIQVLQFFPGGVLETRWSA
jgi:transposase